MAEDTGPHDGMTFLEHLEELSRRLKWTLLALTAAFAACYPFSQAIFEFMQRPLRQVQPDAKLTYLELSEPFFVHLKVAALAGVFVASPVIMAQVWLFVAPGLYRNEKRYVIPFVLTSTACFLLGGYFAFSLLFPTVCNFFLEQGQSYQMQVTLERYFGALFWTVLGVAATFELPVMIGLLARLGIVTPAFLIQNLHIAVVGCMVVAALITPTPDALTMMFVAAPMFALYGLGIGVAYLVRPGTGERPPKASP